MIAAAFGEDAVLVETGAASAPDRAARAHAVARAIAAARPGADVVVGGACVAVHGARDASAIEAIARAAIADARGAGPAGRAHTIAVAYDGPDLEEVADATGLAPGDVARVHAEREYTVEIVGFLPGFGYLAGLDPRLVVPRRAAPRPRVPAQSLAVAGEHTGVYPFASPGGWRLVGRAIDAALFDPTRARAARLSPGDRVRFAVARDAPPPAPPAPRPAPRAGAALVVERAPPGATIQDRGRPGRLAEGVPASGPLDPDAHAAANARVDNDEGAAAIELPLGEAVFRARGDVIVSVDGEPARRLRDGEPLAVPAIARAVRYVALRGGVDVPRVLGARATLLVAGLGGLGGRALRPRDVLLVGDDAPRACAAPRPLPEPAEGAILDVDLGPHAARFPAGAIDALLAGPLRVSRLGDRVGVRLEGARVPHAGAGLGLPVPMLRGAVQVASDGTPIVLGPDHPATGGYPVIAVLRRASVARLARLRPGAALRFRLA